MLDDYDIGGHRAGFQCFEEIGGLVIATNMVVDLREMRGLILDKEDAKLRM